MKKFICLVICLLLAYITLTNKAVIGYNCSTPTEWLNNANRNPINEDHGSNMLGSGNIHPGHQWPGGIVKYHLNTSLTETDKLEVNLAFEEYHSKTCIRFEPCNISDHNYVNIELDDNVCGLAHVCMIGGNQFAKFGQSCRHKDTMVHELGHSLCLGHEHQRKDRDDFLSYSVTCEANVRNNLKKQFENQNRGFYDYASQMHYSCGEGTCGGGVPKNRHVQKCGAQLQSGLSVLDADYLNDVYSCQGCFRHRWIPIKSISDTDKMNMHDFGYKDLNSVSLYPCRTFFRNELAIGRYNSKTEICYFTYNQLEYYISQGFEVLTIPGGPQSSDSEYFIDKVDQDYSSSDVSEILKDAISGGYKIGRGKAYLQSYVAFASIPNFKMSCDYEPVWWSGGANISVQSIGKLSNYPMEGYRASFPLCGKEFSNSDVGSYYVLSCGNTVKVVVSLARQGEFNMARKELKKVENYETLMAEIVEKLYNGNRTRTLQILELFGEMSCVAYGEGLEKLINKIEDYGKLADAEVLIVARYMNIFKICHESSKKVADIVSAFQAHVDTFLGKWALNISRSEFDKIYNFSESGDYERDSVNRQIGNIIEKVYATRSANAFNATIEFANGMPFLEDMVTIYQSIVHELKKEGQTYGNDMMTVSYWTHWKIKNNWSRMPKTTQDLYTDLKNSIPTEIRNLFWHDSCSIKNMHWNEYLYATNGVRDNTEGNGDAFTWTPGTGISSGKWILTPSRHVNDGVRFEIKNKYLDGSDHYLCESKKTKSVLTCSDDSLGYRLWFLKYSIRVVNSGFIIKNSAFNSVHQDYLQATSTHNVNLTRRNVEDKESGESSYWKIDCS